MASEQTKLEFGLLETQNKLDYFKQKVQREPNALDQKWVEIFTDRLQKIKKNLGKTN